MKAKNFTPLQAIQHIREQYKSGKLSMQQEFGDCEYYHSPTDSCCAVGCLFDFTEDEKLLGVRTLSDENIRIKPNEHDTVAIGAHNGTICGIKAGDFKGIQTAHDVEEWEDFEKELTKLESKYA